MHWLWLIIVGAIVGALGRLLHPGRDPGGWIVTIVLGIVSLLIAGAILHTTSTIVQIIVGVIIAFVILFIWARFARGRASTA
jgi:uncharacterized membrane protein YeaQ/YmgE (transglycosylase-associated protein family)